MKNRRVGRTRIAVEVETLEGRVLLAGVTLITHGWELTSDRPGWLDSMADAIVASAGPATSVYDMRIARNSAGTSASVVYFGLISGPGFSDSSNADAVVMLDWADASGVDFNDYFSTGDLASQLVAPLLTETDPSIGINEPLADVPIHLIGHSRGASLVSELAKDLGQSGIWVDQLTTLDPDPVNSDPPVTIYDNVTFADNYYQTDELEFHGSYVAGADNTNLSGVFQDGTGDHTDVHAYYDGTISQSAPDDGDGTPIYSNWYNYAGTGPRSSVGFNWSAIGGGPRPSDGLSSAFGGSVSSPAVPNVSGTQWANIDDVTLTDSGSQFKVGQPLNVTFRYEDASSTPTISLYLDNDQSPFDGAGYQVESSTRTSGASVYQPSSPLPLDTSGVPAGQYFLYAKITDGTDTRFAYDTTPITLTNPTPPSINGIVYDDITGDGFSADDTRVRGMPINLYQSDGTTLITSTTTASDGSFSFNNLTPGGSYVWQQALPAGWTLTSPTGGWSATGVLNDQSYTGNFADFQNISISGAVFNDLTGNSFSADDTLLNGVTLDLYQNGGTTAIQTANTGTTGFYSFNNLGPGTYYVQEEVPANWTQTGGINGYSIAAESGQNATDKDFDNAGPPPASDGGIVYQDITGNGITNDDLPLGGVIIDLYQSDGTTLASSTTSAADGSFTFGNLTPGNTYILDQSVPSGWTQTYPSGSWAPITVASGERYAGNFADFQNISIAGTVFNDITDNGFSSDDTPSAGVTVNLYQGDSSIIFQTTATASDGSYSFSDLGPGVYAIIEVAPTGEIPTGGIGGYGIAAQSGQNITSENFDNFIPPPPAAPVSLTAAAVSTSQINLSWSDPTNDETGFYIDRWSAADQTWIQIGSTTSTSYSDKYLQYATEYSYSIQAYNSSGTSDFTSVVSATTKGYLPDLTPNFWYTATSLPPGAKRNKVGLEIKNAGNLTINAKLPINLYASADQTYESSDLLIASLSTKMNIRAGNQKFVTLKFNSPSNVPDGNFYLLADVNPGDTVAESDYSNDIAAADTTTSIRAPYIDLVPGFSPPAELARGSRSKARVTVTNNGNVLTGVATTFVMLLSPGNSTTVDASILGSLDKSLKLKPGQTRSFSMTFIVPANASGNYLAISLQDASIVDSDPGNNTTFSADPVTLI